MMKIPTAYLRSRCFQTNNLTLSYHLPSQSLISDELTAAHDSKTLQNTTVNRTFDRFDMSIVSKFVNASDEERAGAEAGDQVVQ